MSFQEIVRICAALGGFDLACCWLTGEFKKMVHDRKMKSPIRHPERDEWGTKTKSQPRGISVLEPFTF